MWSYSTQALKNVETTLVTDYTDNISNQSIKVCVNSNHKCNGILVVDIIKEHLIVGCIELFGF